MITDTKPESNDLAIASLVLGILSLTGMGPFTGIPAVITGWLALRKNDINKGMAITGIITGALSVAFALLIIMFFVLLLFLGVFATSSYDMAPEYYDEAPDSTNFQQRA